MSNHLTISNSKIVKNTPMRKVESANKEAALIRASCCLNRGFSKNYSGS